MTSYNPIFVADAELGTAQPQLVIIYPLFMFLANIDTKRKGRGYVKR